MLYTHTLTHTSAALAHPSSGLNRNGAPPLRVAAYEALYYHIFDVTSRHLSCFWERRIFFV